MLELVGTLLPLGLGIALSPFPIIMIVLMLSTAQARTNGLSFTAGWLVGIAVLVTVPTLLLDAVEEYSEETSDVVAGIVRIALGLLLLFFAYRKIMKRLRRSGDDSGDDGLPGWMASTENTTPLKSLRSGLLISAANPKNVALAAAAGVTVTAAHLSATSDVWGIVVFVLIASMTILVPVAGYLIVPARMDAPLQSVKGWMSTNHGVMTALLLLVFGVVLIGNGLGSF